MRVVDVEAEGIELNKLHLHLVVEGMQEGLKLGQKLHDLIGQDVDVTAEKHREKRSLNANSYFYVLCGKIADVLGTSKAEVHNEMLARYGQEKRDADGNLVCTLAPASVDYSKEETRHYKPTGQREERNGFIYYWYIEMKPSHEYNSQEFAKLLDGVISECKELDIEVLSDDEIKRMEEAYRGDGSG